MKNYNGIIIKESLEDREVLEKVKILKKNIEHVTREHKTPWIEKWTLYTVEITESHTDKVAEQLSKSLDSKHNWYADFKNEEYHFIIFRNKVFKVDRKNQKEYEKVIYYGISLGIPKYQLDFSPKIK